jgi:hypothetical protein
MSKIKTNEIIVAEYSLTNRAFNIGTLSSVIGTNKESAVKGIESDFIIFGAFASYDEAEEACQEMQFKQDAYQEKFGIDADIDEEVFPNEW